MNYRPVGFRAISPNEVKSFILDKFLGVDFTNGDYTTDYRRSPDALNMVWGVNPYLPETRSGYKQILSSALDDLEIYGIHVNTVSDEILVHAGSNLYLLAGSMDSYTSAVIATGLSEQPTTSFMMNGKLYIVGGGEYLQYDGADVDSVTDIAFVPTTVIARRYDGGGTVFEAVNLLSIKKKNSFYVESVPEAITNTFTGDTSETVFTLSESAITATDFVVTLADVVQELYTNYTIDRVLKTVTFISAPAAVEILIKYEINEGDNYPTTYLLDSTYIDYRTITVTVSGVVLVEGDVSVVDEFTGDGETVEFELSTNSSITDTDFVITQGGETTSSDDYTIDRDNKTVTFDTAPTDEIAISITYEISDYSIDRETGIITFVVAPEPLTRLSGVDSIIVEFSKSVGDETKIVYVEEIATGSTQTEWALTGTTTSTVNTDDFSITSDDFTVTVGETSPACTVDRINKTLTFDAAPAVGTTISITYNILVDTRADAINDCTIFGIYGGEQDSRVFLSNNSNHKAIDWYSGLLAPTYFPDTGYDTVGNNSTAIMGYIKSYDLQVIIKEDGYKNDAAQLRSFSLGANVKPSFRKEQGSVNIGAVSKRCFGYLQEEALFLSSQGVVAMVGTDVDNHRLIQDRSEKVNSRLTQEANMENAFSVVYKNKYYLFINGNVYVADARMRYADSLGNIQYEWNFWNNVNADCAVVYDGYLLFGFNGMIFRFKLSNEKSLYIDVDYNGTPSSINSYWTTPKLFFGSISNRKNSHNIYLLFGKQSRISANIKCEVNGDYTIDLGTYTRDALFSYRTFEYGLFTYSTVQKSIAKNIYAGLKGYDNVKFIFSNVTDTISNVGVGIELLQVNYSYLDN